VPAVCTYVPAAQLLKEPQLEAFWVVLNLPAAQGEQERSLVVLPED
jgi:hypothetical protein